RALRLRVQEFPGRDGVPGRDPAPAGDIKHGSRPRTDVAAPGPPRQETLTNGRNPPLLPWYGEARVPPPTRGIAGGVTFGGNKADRREPFRQRSPRRRCRKR